MFVMNIFISTLILLKNHSITVLHDIFSSKVDWHIITALFVNTRKYFQNFLNAFF